MEVQLFLVLKGKKAVRKWSTKWYIADVCSAANPIKVLYIVSSRILIVSNLGTTREQVEIGETLCSALQSGSSIQLFSVISLFILEQSLWLRWEPHMRKKKKKNSHVCSVFVGKISHKSVLSAVDPFRISWPQHILCCILLSLSLPSCC